MKTLFSIFSLAVFSLCFYPNLHAQNNETEYVIVEYMKVKPGMQDQYRECEAAWKLVHQARKKAGNITGWQLERMVYPSGTNTEYDYLTITHYKNWAALDAENSTTWNAAFATLPEDKREIANNAQQYRDLVKREIWTAGDRVFAPGNSKSLYRVENFMKIPNGGWDDWVEMETRFVKPVHEKSIAMGNRAGWLMGFMVFPRGADLSYQASTVDFFNTWEDMDKEDGNAWEAVYPGMSDSHISHRINDVRTLVKTEVRMLVDYVE